MKNMFNNPWPNIGLDTDNLNLFKNDLLIIEDKVTTDKVTIDNVTVTSKKTYKYSSKFKWFEERALLILDSLISTLEIPRVNAYLIVAQSAAEAGYENAVSNNYFGIGGVNKKSYKSFNECFIDFQILINSKWPNYFNILKTANLDSDQINKALNSGPYIKPYNWFKDSLFSYNLDLDNHEPLKLKVYNQYDRKKETYNDNDIIFKNVPVRIMSGIKNYGRLILSTYETVIKIAIEYYDYKYESCIEIINNNKIELKKNNLSASKRKEIFDEIKLKESEKWNYPLMGYTVSQFKVIDKNTKVSNNKIHQDDNVFASYKDNIMYINSK